MFGLFGKKESNNSIGLLTDRVYISKNAKDKAIVSLASTDTHAIFIGWFTDTVNYYKSLFESRSLETARIHDAKTVNMPVLENKAVIFLEHYPIQAKETTFCESRKLEKSVVYSSLDEPLFKHFGSDKMIPIIKMLGMKEEEAIEHSFVSEAIQKAQLKISEKVMAEISTHSQEEWLKKNLSE